MTGKVLPTSSGPLPFKVKLQEEVNGFKISGQTAVKNFMIGEKNLKITIKFPQNIKNDADLKTFLKKNYGEDKIQLYGKMAVTAGVGIDATALSIKQTEGKLNFERHLNSGQTEKLNDEYFKTKESNIKNSKMDESGKQAELKKLKDLNDSINNIKLIFEGKAFKGSIQDKEEPKRLPITEKEDKKIQAKHRRESEPLPLSETRKVSKNLPSEKEKQIQAKINEQFKKPLPLTPVLSSSEEIFHREKKRLEFKWSQIQQDINKNKEHSNIMTPGIETILKNDTDNQKKQLFKEVSHLLSYYNVNENDVANYFEQNPTHSIDNLHAFLYDQHPPIDQNAKESNQGTQGFENKLENNSDSI